MLGGSDSGGGANQMVRGSISSFFGPYAEVSSANVNGV